MDQVLDPSTAIFSKVLKSPTEVTARIEEMAREILVRYKDQNPLFICLLRGGAPFAARLMFAIAAQDTTFHPELDYLTVKTYGNKLTSKEPTLIMGLAPNSAALGRTTIILDDVLDEGHTAAFTKKYLIANGAARVDLIVLVQKVKPRPAYSNATMFGFEAPADWLTGMGMDDPRLASEANRWLGLVAIANTQEDAHA